MRFTRRRLVTGLTAVAAAAGGLAGIRAAQARYYVGDLSDHFDGLRFVDPHGVPPKGIPDLIRWWGSRGGRDGRQSGDETAAGESHAEREPISLNASSAI